MECFAERCSRAGGCGLLAPLGKSGPDSRQWLQFDTAKRLAKARAAIEHPADELEELRMANAKHLAIYAQAARRITSLLQDGARHEWGATAG